MAPIHLLLFVVFARLPMLSQANSIHDSIHSAVVVGTDRPCGSDGICNLGACDHDPDCPSLPSRQIEKRLFQVLWLIPIMAEGSSFKPARLMYSYRAACGIIGI